MLLELALTIALTSPLDIWPPKHSPDINLDGRVDQFDVAIFNSCVTGPAVPVDYSYSSVCKACDLDIDFDVDQDDFGILQRSLGY